MDTSDPKIHFDPMGICNHCRGFDEVLRGRWHDGPGGLELLQNKIREIKRSQKDKDYDCIIGLSGGIDSSYLAIRMVEMGLRPLIVHVDAGWNSEVAVQNIEKLVKRLNLDLHTIVIDWEEMRDMQLAFLRSGVPNQDIPQDHAFFAALYGFAIKFGVRWVLSGDNVSSESILPESWGFNAMDSRHLLAIHRQFGERKLRSYPVVGFWKLYFGYPIWHRMRVLKPLDYLPYNKLEAKKLLIEQYGWKDYGAKHYESIWTKFFQGHYLPSRWGYDKRLAHLSSLVVAGQMSREQALSELERPRYDADELRRDKAYVRKKLGLTETEFETIISAPLRAHSEYPSNKSRFNWMRNFAKRLPFYPIIKKAYST